MFIYAVGTLPLISTVDHPHCGSQVWYADDASACAQLKDWLIKLMKHGPSFGYHSAPNKSFIVVSKDYLQQVHSLFDSLEVNVVTSKRLLGGVVGSSSEKYQFVKDFVWEWTQLLDQFATVAQTQPQAVYLAFTRSVQNKWLYLQRLIPDYTSLFTELEAKISSTLLPAIFQCEISPAERELFSLSTKFGGLNILIPTE